ncbi:hypothetical protein EAH_00042570 [Eimeria acervulina]|uniref:Uncharacterized protein n=1 Tax=Eimeria acervulina TaxID=5801 RepID=U6GIG1_EIMAC|nr:hypothetical protein EAH_00042570 [Eimeria acervulina]CDI79362.1 hypothetical protein EAH_00042570 [Eimeria acervulina]
MLRQVKQQLQQQHLLQQEAQKCGSAADGFRALTARQHESHKEKPPLLCTSLSLLQQQQLKLILEQLQQLQQQQQQQERKLKQLKRTDRQA